MLLLLLSLSLSACLRRASVCGDTHLYLELSGRPPGKPPGPAWKLSFPQHAQQQQQQQQQQQRAAVRSTPLTPRRSPAPLRPCDFPGWSALTQAHTLAAGAKKNKHQKIPAHLRCDWLPESMALDPQLRPVRLFRPSSLFLLPYTYPSLLARSLIPLLTATQSSIYLQTIVPEASLRHDYDWPTLSIAFASTQHT